MIILMPVYNDWTSLDMLISGLDDHFSADTTRILIVNDCSTELIPTTFNCSIPLEVLHLTQNLGHQKAIAVGLSYACDNYPGKSILIMDADGNDLPSDAKLLADDSLNTHSIILARRTKRNETRFFRLVYYFYLLSFRILTGRNIRYGNFCVIPFSQVKKIIHLNNLWLHLPATIIKSKLPYKEVSTSKGKRLDGKSKMSIPNFFLHGLGALAVFTDIIAVRILVASVIAILASLIALIIIISIRLTTDLAIPGWASSVGSSLVIIMLLSFFISIFLIFIFIFSQSSRKFIPAIHYKDYIAG